MKEPLKQRWKRDKIVEQWSQSHSEAVEQITYDIEN